MYLSYNVLVQSPNYGLMRGYLSFNPVFLHSFSFPPPNHKLLSLHLGIFVETEVILQLRLIFELVYLLPLNILKQ